MSNEDKDILGSDVDSSEIQDGFSDIDSDEYDSENINYKVPDNDTFNDININLKQDENNISSLYGLRITGEDLETIKTRIKTTVDFLESRQNDNTSNSNLKYAELSRSEILSKLADDVSLLYGYNVELAEYLLNLFSPKEAIEFFDANENQRPLTIRTNMLKTRRRDLAHKLISRGANVDPIGEWTKVGLIVYSSSVPIGATPEYLSGYYMIQSASSLIPVMALAPQPGEKILDMAAAPGGKTTYIGQLMKNSGILYANDLRRDRCTALIANLHRMGICNSVVINMDGKELGKYLPKLDRILLDAPCTGLGIISRDPSVKVKRTIKELNEYSLLQKELLKSAIDMIDANSKTGGFVVYSTCSISFEENEAVVDYILKVRNVKLVPLGIEIGSPGLSKFRENRLNPTISKYSRRIYPHKNNMDGFFVAKFKKISNDIPKNIKRDRNKTNKHVKTWGKERWTEQMLSQISLDIDENKKNNIHVTLDNKDRKVGQIHGTSQCSKVSTKRSRNKPGKRDRMTLFLSKTKKEDVNGAKKQKIVKA
ncbi:NOL1/NOP2/sun family protein [Cryptosporidium muris RN66]|uniref:NOL1/NOP2/sun family protein n=1 Tax=Cryptosporidium muris (strain RN66) TaxID=441375 RepID=B6AIE8_CRYMR|nr:NOL1/NOP2/sun family protein [Cryptosporidium muris RN66]EEA07989.1 NOL1/NOP2/sun family protein [Cryptosporidium muris RN66]|eukprot:XP_002142338.1 NOL1/NOP2/sun family protein [Cryptosporidium muris RN66]